MTRANPRARIPFHRDVKTLALLAQLAFLALIAAGTIALLGNARRAVEAQGLSLSFEFLSRPAGFSLAEGPAFSPDDSYLEAFLVGLYNTAKVSGVGILLASLLGLVMGIARLSSNWLVNRLALLYVEAIRNTPLLVQVVFWYFAVMLQLPDVREAIRFGRDVYLSQRGLTLPWLEPTEAFGSFWPWVVAGVVLSGLVWFRLARRRARTGESTCAGPVALGVLVLAVSAGYAAAGSPFEVVRPTLGTFRLTGGLTLSPEFTALLTALTVYFGAFIAEIVRGGIQAVDRGQWEAARSLGLSYHETLRLVVLPQALPVILPPLGNQYLNLTKASSLAVAIGYPDVFSVANVVGSQSGNSIQVMILVLATYLLLSLLIAGSVNLLNRLSRLRTRHA